MADTPHMGTTKVKVNPHTGLDLTTGRPVKGVKLGHTGAPHNVNEHTGCCNVCGVRHTEELPDFAPAKVREAAEKVVAEVQAAAKKKKQPAPAPKKSGNGKGKTATK